MLLPRHEKGRRGLSRLERPRAEHRAGRRRPGRPRTFRRTEPRRHWCGPGVLVGMGPVPVLVLPTFALLRLSAARHRAGTARVHPAVCAARPTVRAGCTGARVILVLLSERPNVLPDGSDVPRAVGEGSAAAMRRALGIPVALAVLLWTGVAWSADALSERAAAIERASMEPDGTRVVVGHISRKLAISVETLRAQRAQTEFGWGDLLIAHRLAKVTGRTFEQIAAESRSGKTWEEIARVHDVDSAKLVADLQQSLDAIEKRSEDRPPNRETLFGPGKKNSNVGRQHY